MGTGFLYSNQEFFILSAKPKEKNPASGYCEDGGIEALTSFQFSLAMYLENASPTERYKKLQSGEDCSCLTLIV